MSEEVKVLSASETKKEDWMNSKWRPMMGWMYMGVCIFDFVVAPVLWSLTQAMFHGGVNVQWQPLTLQGAGLFHISMGAVLGLAAYGRTQEKLNGATNANTGLQPVSQSVTTTFGQTSPGIGQPSGPYNSPGANSWGTTPIMGGSGGYQPGYGATPPMGNSFGSPAQVTTGFGGKLAPPMPEYYPER